MRMAPSPGTGRGRVTGASTSGPPGREMAIAVMLSGRVAMVESSPLPLSADSGRSHRGARQLRRAEERAEGRDDKPPLRDLFFGGRGETGEVETWRVSTTSRARRRRRMSSGKI